MAIIPSAISPLPLFIAIAITIAIAVVALVRHPHYNSTNHGQIIYKHVQNLVIENARCAVHTASHVPVGAVDGIVEHQYIQFWCGKGEQMIRTVYET